MAGISLKAQNFVPLAMLTVLQLVAVMLVNHKSFDMNQMASLQEASGVMLAIGALAGWLSYLLPADLKNSLVFLRWSNALPGHRFIQLAENDPRINSEAFRARIVNYEMLISDHKEQNGYWYREFYRPVVNQDEVVSTHKSYLLYRDAAAVSLLSAIFFVLENQFIDVPAFGLDLGSAWVFVGAFSGFIVAASNSGRRLVTTAVAINMASGK